MDAKARLRVLLEQRLEAGETELIFETLTATQAIAMLGNLERAAPTGPDGGWRDELRAAGASPAGRAQREEPGEPRRRPSHAAESPPPAWVPAPKPGIAPTAPMQPRPGLVAGKADMDMFAGPFSHLNSLEEIAAAVAGCTRCPLYETAKNPVPGTGHPNADLVCVGEAPGATEDEQGKPFVGQAGQLLTRILAAIDLSREDVFICNVLKHRPPLNRNPLPHEVQACSPYLLRQLELIQPKAILALGTFAAQTLLQTSQTIGQLRGFVHRYYGIPLVVTYHPAALLRNPSWKRPTWEDVKLVRRILDSAAVAP